MRLSALVASLSPAPAGSRGGDDPIVRGISYDSRAVAPGDLFVALRGSAADGHAFLAQALGLGAVAVVVEEIPEGLDAARPAGHRRRRLAARAGRAGDALLRGALRRAGADRRHGNQRKDQHDLPDRIDPRARRAPRRADRHRRVEVRRPAAARAQHHAGEPRSPDVAARDAEPRRGRGRDGGLLARPPARARRRLPVQGRRLHQPDPGSPRLPRHDGGLPRGQGPALLALPRQRRGRRRERRRSRRPRARARGQPRRRERDPRLARRRGRGPARIGGRPHGRNARADRDPGGASRAGRAAAGRLQPRERAGRLRRRRRARQSPRRRSRRASRPARRCRDASSA